ncbi:MAG: hypothetical protein KBB11_02125 [Bacteroidales bacterium]|nr:hypothetical protein [Bacteroidales bacterium]HOY38966.1 hypothetical protein [Bacteroidales bacterium]HQP04012.1 hypothetical protein [Bacteroidales bacterium]
MKNIYIFIITLIMAMYGSIAFAQNQKMIGEIQDSDEKIIPGAFDEELFSKVLIKRLNHLMEDSLFLEGYVLHEFFKAPAEEHAKIMAEDGSASIEGKGEYATIKSRLELAGGSGSGFELVAKSSIRNGDANFTYNQLADFCINRWLTSSKTREPLLRQQYFFAGIGAKFDTDSTKIYISMYVGNWESFLQGSERYDELPFQVSKKKFGLKLPEPEMNRKMLSKAKRRFPNLLELQSGLSVNENGEIYFKYSDLRGFKRIMRNSKDGLAVDIVQTCQFDNCGETNIVDFGRRSRGIMLKPVLSKKMFKNNIAPPEGTGKRKKVKKLEVYMGQMPEGLNPDDAELNLVFIQNKYIVTNIHPTYIDKAIYNYAQKIDLLPDTLLPDGISEYFPSATSTKLSFRIPFEQGKFNYDSDDMIPVLTALNEPAFIINKIHIAAYSSLEGSEAENAALQKKRANSIVSALEENQNASIIDSITTAPNFEQLKTDVKGTPFEKVAEMNYKEAIQYVNAHAGEMEYLLKNHRYADVTIWVTYDVEGDKEQAYVLDQFNKEVAAERYDKALAIQKYIFKRVVEGRYNSKAVSGMVIPNIKPCVGLNMNKICLERIVANEPVDSTYLERIEDLQTMDGENIYVRYNDIYCEVMLSNMDNTNVVEELQGRIDNLYSIFPNKMTVDLLNIELQYQIMEVYKDSLGFDNPVVIAGLNKIKQIVGATAINWENALKMAGIFINHYDYEYAYQLLWPWVDKDPVNTSLLYSYVSLASKVEYRCYSNRFLMAMEKLKQHDPKGFCKLFRGDKFSVQVYANEKLKELYCNSCKQ